MSRHQSHPYYPRQEDHAPVSCFPSTDPETVEEDFVPIQCFPNVFPFTMFRAGRRSTDDDDNDYSSFNQRPLMPFDGCLIVFVLGGPGSGKGTQCDRIAKEFGLIHVSTGDLLREEVTRGGSLAEEIDLLMKDGKMVPMSVTKKLLLRSMEKSGRGVPGFLIDGFPRTMEQAAEFEKSIGRCTFVLDFDCPADVLTERLANRGKTSGRVDDNLESIKKRIQVFINDTVPVIEFYEREGRIRRVNANAAVDQVTKDTLENFRHLKKGTSR